MNKPIYICLDVGNVLVHLDFQPFVEKLSSTFNISLEDANYFLHRTTKFHDIGLTTMEEELKNHYQIKSPILMKELLNIWDKTIFSNWIMNEKLLEWSKQKNVHIALLSNVGVEHIKIMEKILGLSNIPNLVRHFSCQVGARKPNKIYYQSFLAQYPQWRGSLYLDDLEPNLEAGKMFGFRTYQFSLEPHLGRSDLLKEKLKTVEELIFA